MQVKTLDAHIDISPDVCGGKPRIAGRRIAVQDIVIWRERLRWAADEIVTEYGLSLADVYAALAYYFDHREEIDQSIHEEIDQSIHDGDALVKALREKTPSKLDQSNSAPTAMK